MNSRIILAGLLGGVGMFVWSTIAHMVLPLGQTGIAELPNEQAVLDALKTNIGEKQRGFYYFPGPGVAADATADQRKEAMKHYAEKYEANPTGILIYHHPGKTFKLGRWLTVEFATEVLESILAVFLLAQTRLVGFGARVGFILVIGIIAAVATNVPYWNWYGFPKTYTAAYMFTQVVGFFVAGIVAALVLGRRSSAAG